MNDKLKSLFGALQPGQTLGNSVEVTQWANLVTLLVAAFTAVMTILHVFGVTFNLDDGQIATLAGSVATLVLVVRTLISKMTNVAPALPDAVKPKKDDDPQPPLDAVADVRAREEKWKRDSLLP